MSIAANPNFTQKMKNMNQIDVDDDTEVERNDNKSIATHYEAFLHPNEIEQKLNSESDCDEKTGCTKVFSDFDNNYLRPFLVYKYDIIKDQPELEVEDYLKECKLIEEELIEATVNFRKLKAGGAGTSDNTFSGLIAQGDSRHGTGLMSHYVRARTSQNGIALGQTMKVKQGPGGFQFGENTMKLSKPKFGAQAEPETGFGEISEEGEGEEENFRQLSKKAD